MPSITEAIRLELVGDATVAGLVGSRVHWDKAARTSEVPYVVLSRISSEMTHHQGGPSGYDRFDMDATVYAASAASRETIVGAILNAIDGTDGTIQGVDRVVIKSNDRSDRIDEPLDRGSESDLYAGTLTMSVWHSR